MFDFLKSRRGAVSIANVRFRFLLIFAALAVLLVLAAGSCSKAPKTVSEEEFQIALAKHLKAIGSTIYEMEDCGWCEEQMNWFGEGSQYIDQVYCLGPEQVNPQPILCKTKGIEGMPTWEIKGEMYKGARALVEWAKLSGYDGPLPEGMSLTDS